MAEQIKTSVDRHHYDLAVAYRIYPQVSKPAQTLPFGNDKLHQAAICLRSFKQSLGSVRAKIWAILDGCPNGYRSLFEDYFAAEDLVFVEMDRAGNRATYRKQLDILLSQKDADFVYLAEDDYFYLPDQFPLLLRFLREAAGVDFITPYDHPDCYSLALHSEPKWVTTFGGHHWRTAASTCLTFVTRKGTLARYERVFRTYCHRNDDCAMWLSLTKRRVRNPIALATYILRREFYRWAPVKAWLFCWPQILFGKQVSLWAPIPSAATHLSVGLLAPIIDWAALMRAEEIPDGVGGQIPPRSGQASRVDVADHLTTLGGSE